MMHRRDVLKGFAAGIVGVAALPALDRVARAAVLGNGRARAQRLLVLYMGGGVRSSACFHASQQKAFNPWGVIKDTRTQFQLGKLLDDYLEDKKEKPPGDDAYQLSYAWQNAKLPRLRELARSFSVIGSWNPERGDHQRAYNEEATGNPSGSEPGLLVRLYAGLGDAANRAEVTIPPFDIAAVAQFSATTPPFAQATPISVANSSSLPGASTPETSKVAARTGHDWIRDDAMRDRFDLGRSAHLAGRAKQLVDTYAAHRRTMQKLGEGLASPWVNVAGEGNGDATQGKVKIAGQEIDLSNAMLNEIFMKAVDPSEPGSRNDASSNLSLAIRCLQLGSPAVVVTVPDFDLHSGEITQAPPHYRYFGRLWSSLGWLLQSMPDPSAPGKTMFDTTLVLTMSDFGRDPGSPSTGFNGGDGSDHGSSPATFYLAHGVMGAGVPGGRLFGTVNTDTYDAKKVPTRFSPRQVLATVLEGFGLDPRNEQWGFPDVGVTVDLWGGTT